MKKNLVLIFLSVLLISLPIAAGHGVDVTSDVMIIANESNGQLTKDIADNKGVDVSVYKFTSESEVAHQLEHMLTNNNKRILIVAYQNTANEFLKNHNELSDRLIIIDDVNNETIEEGIIKLTNLQRENSQENDDFAFILPLTIGLIIGLISGLGLGIFLIKNKN